MKPKGLLFKSEMIRALLNTQIDSWPAKPVDESQPWKWQTRRAIQPQPTPDCGTTIHLETYCPEKVNKRTGDLYPGKEVLGFYNEDYGWVCPYPVGLILYAKETFKVNVNGHYIYKADIPRIKADEVDRAFGPWKPSIFMPKSAARLWFRVMNVRVERVNEISELDAFAEGCAPAPSKQYDIFAYTKGYAKLWDSINGIGDFDKGKYVWVYEIARITKPV